MRLNKVSGFVFYILIVSSFQIFGQPKIYLVRHSEKIENWQSNLTDYQPLNETGINTSKRLKKYFESINLTAVYSSALTRTLQTAYYISESKNLEIKIEKACSDTSFIGTFLDSLSKIYSSGSSVLIVSHSNIIPYFLIKLGLKKEKFDEFNFTINNNLWLTDYYGEIFIIDNKNDSIRISKKKF